MLYILIDNNFSKKIIIDQLNLNKDENEDSDNTQGNTWKCELK